MNKTVLYLLLFCTGIASAQIVAIPDANFKSKLLAANTNNNIAKNSSGASMKVDANNDTYIQQSEVDAVYELDVSASGITNMSGIQEFDNLQVLNCEGNSITTLTVTALADLETLYCSSNSITTLNISGLANLRTLYCSENNLSAINFTGVTDLRWLECNNNDLATFDATSLSNLRELKCSGNAMSSLSVTNLVDLSVLECSNNNLTTLDLTGLDHLEILVCRQNYLTALDFTGLEYLVSLHCSNNQITTLDLSGCPAFNELDCSQNALTFINIKNGSTQIYDVTTAPNDWSGNTGLEFICIDESETAIVDTILTANSIIVNYNTYCSFVPGGDYNTITGTMLFDGDNDGCDTGDAPQPFIKIGIGGAETGATFTDEAGVYDFYTLAGTFNLTPMLENSSFFTVTSTSDSVTFPLVDNSVAIDNFCIAPNGVHPDVEVVIEPLMPAVPGGQATYKVVYKNKGNQVLSGSVTLSCDENFIDYSDVDPLPDNIAPNIYTWNYSNLRPFENREIKVTLDINSPTDTPPVNIGDTILFSSTITTTSGDDLPQDNTFDFDQKAVGAFNPNNIVCIEGDTESPAEIGEYLHYTVNFKNTGTAPVTSIVVKHDIDPTQFDAGSVEVLNSSHAMRAKVAGNTLEFMIPNASLAVADHGNILFKVKTRPSLVAGSTVSNKARIFFDYKFPEVTNNADTMFELLSAGGFEKDNSVTIYPNPVKNILNITSDGTVRYVELYDMQGRLLETGIVNDISTTIDLTSRAAGMYFVKVTTYKGVKVENVIRE
jgi:uncharacterized repeat protein (TIGR01451 family)